MFAAFFVHLKSVFKLCYVIRYLSVLANVAGRIIAITARAIIFHGVGWLVFMIEDLSLFSISRNSALLP